MTPPPTKRPKGQSVNSSRQSVGSDRPSVNSSRQSVGSDRLGGGSRQRGRPMRDLVGQRFGRLVVVRLEGRNEQWGYLVWRCRCDCGQESLVAGQSLVAGLTQSCGCLRKEMCRETGKRYGGNRRLRDSG